MKNFSPLLILSLASGFAVIEYFLLGAGFVFFPETKPLQAAFWGQVGTVVGSFFFFLGSPVERKNLQHHAKEYLPWAVLLGSFVVAIGMLWFWALSVAPIGIIAFLDKILIPISFFLGIVFLKEKISVRQFFWIFLSLVGFFVLSSLDGEISWKAVLAIAIAAFLFSLQSFFAKKYLPHFNFIPFLFFRNTTVVFLMGILLLLFAPHNLAFPDFFAFCIFSLGTAAGFFFGRIFYFEAHKHFDIGMLNFFGLLESVLVLFLSVLLLGESLSLLKIIGSGLVVLGLFLFFREKDGEKMSEDWKDAQALKAEISSHNEKKTGKDWKTLKAV